jgi:Flp pilus assembly pilin Flp
MRNRVKTFLKSQKGMNTVEVVIILAVVVGLAIIFRQKIGAFANGLMDSIFNDPGDLSPGGMRNYTPTPTVGK